MGVALAISAIVILIGLYKLWKMSNPPDENTLSEEWRRNHRYEKEGDRP